MPPGARTRCSVHYLRSSEVRCAQGADGPNPPRLGGRTNVNPTIEKVAWADRHRPGSRLPPLSAAAYPVAGARKTMDVLVRTS
jgi:hypothetical protein